MRQIFITRGVIVNTVLDLDRLKELILQKYRSQSAFAEELNVSRQYVSQILKGDFEPTLERLVQFADLLDVSTDELLGKETTLARVMA